MTKPIASSSFEWRKRGRRAQPVLLELFPPVRDTKGVWACRYRIKGLATIVEGDALGSDSMQALHLAMVGVAKRLAGSLAFRAGELFHYGTRCRSILEFGLPWDEFALRMTLQMVLWNRQTPAALRETMERSLRENEKIGMASDLKYPEELPAFPSRNRSRKRHG